MEGWLKVWFALVGLVTLFTGVAVPLFLVWAAYKLLCHFGVV